MPTEHSALRREPPSDLAAERDRIRALVAGCSLETSTRTPSDIDAYRDQIGAGTDVYVNHFPGETYHQVIAVAARLRRAGFKPVPHVGARNFVGFTQARDCIERLAGEAGVRQVLVIAGDLGHAMGPYASSLALLETGLFQRHGIRRIGVAGYPEAHGRIGSAEIWNALAAKQALVRQAGLEMHIVTQFCFEAVAIRTWIGAVRARGIDLPIRIGLAGPASLRTLLKFALRCGVGASVRALGSDAASIAHLLTQSGPEAVVRALAAAPESQAEIAGLHLFPFGGVAQTSAWIRAVAAGRLDIEPVREGFRVRLLE